MANIREEVHSEWEREYGHFGSRRPLEFPDGKGVPPAIENSYEPYLPGIDGPGMFEPGTKNEDKSWAEDMTQTVGKCYMGASIAGVGYGAWVSRKIGANVPWRMKINAVLNHCGKHGREFGNGLAGIFVVGYIVKGLSQYMRRRKDNYNIVPPVGICGGALGLKRGIYTAMGGAVGGVLIGTAVAGALQQSEGEAVLPELQRVFGVKGGAEKASREIHVDVGDGEEMVMDESEFVEDKA